MSNCKIIKESGKWKNPATQCCEKVIFINIMISFIIISISNKVELPKTFLVSDNVHYVAGVKY